MLIFCLTGNVYKRIIILIISNSIMWYKCNTDKNILNYLSLEHSYIFVISYLFSILQFNDVTIQLL